MKAITIAVLQWLYYLSAILATSLWDHIYQSLITVIDLTSAQSWLLPLGFNLLAMCLGIPVVWSYARAIRKRSTLNRREHLAAISCAVVTALLLTGSVRMAYAKRETLTRAFAEFGDSEVPEVVEAGKVADGMYRNGVAGVEIRLPDQWLVLSVNALRRAHTAGTETIAGGELDEESTDLPPGFYHIFAARKYPESHRGYNPSLLLVAFQKDSSQQAGYPTLESYMEGFRNVSPPHSLQSGLLPKRFGDQIGFHVHLVGEFPDGRVHQRIYGVESDDYYIIATASYQAREDYSTLAACIRALRPIQSAQQERR